MLERESHIRTVAYSYIHNIHMLISMQQRLVTPCCKKTLIRSELSENNRKHCPSCKSEFHRVFVKMIHNRQTTVDERFNLTYETGLPLKLGKRESLSTRQKVILAFKNNEEPELEPGETIPLDLRIAKVGRCIFRALVYRAVLLDKILFNLPSRIGKVFSKISFSSIFSGVRQHR